MNVFEYLNEISLTNSNASADEIRIKSSVALSMLQAVASGDRDRKSLLDMFDRKAELFLIAEDGEPGSFWSNADGFVESGFSFFSKEETATLNLPVGGRWVSLREAVAEFSPPNESSPGSR